MIIPHARATASKYLFHVAIHPPAEKDATLSYGFEAVLLEGMAMSAEAAAAEASDKTLGCEYASLLVGFPWQRLTLTVRFPAGYSYQSAHAIVYIGESNNQHARETERAQKQLLQQPSEITMTIDEPLLNFQYLIYWKAPSGAELAESKNKLASRPAIPDLGGTADAGIRVA